MDLLDGIPLILLIVIIGIRMATTFVWISRSQWVALILLSQWAITVHPRGPSAFESQAAWAGEESNLQGYPGGFSENSFQFKAGSQDPDLREIVLKAFAQVHDGRSSDAVILDPELNRRFIAACLAEREDLGEFDCNWTLMNLRKGGQLSTRATRRGPRNSAVGLAVAEIAARGVIDRHQTGLDRIFCDPELRAEFDLIVKTLDPELEIYAARTAAMQLRKQRRLQPELIARIADWGRKVETFSYQQLVENPDLTPPLPGIYLFLDPSGYLYIGQSDNLHARLKTHFRESHNFSLTDYLQGEQKDRVMIELHSFPADSRARETMIRRAYESELISSRKPRFNILP